MDIISLDEFNQLPHKDQVAVHRELKNTIGINGILEAWNLSRNKYYYMVKREISTRTIKRKTDPQKNGGGCCRDQNGQQKVEQSKTKQINPDNEKIAFDISIQGSTKVISSILESITETYDSDRVFQVNMSVRQI